jgi:hypothetical protein
MEWNDSFYVFSKFLIKSKSSLCLGLLSIYPRAGCNIIPASLS